jgi:nucleoid DNA-binding protein
MTTADPIHAMAERTGLSRPEAAVVVESIVAVLEEALQRGEFAQIVGLGCLTVRQQQAWRQSPDRRTYHRQAPKGDGL